jgi:hypothetical protein
MCSHEYSENPLLVLLSAMEKQGRSLAAGAQPENRAPPLRATAPTLRVITHE